MEERKKGGGEEEEAGSKLERQAETEQEASQDKRIKWWMNPKVE